MATWVVILISVGLGLLGTTKAMVQGKFSKDYARNGLDVGKLIFWSFIIAIVCVLPFVIAFNQWDPRMILWGLLAGLFNGIYQYFYSFSLKKGPMGLSVLINQLAMIFPIIFSVGYYGEAFDVFRIVATVFIIISFFLNAKKDEKTKTSVKWFILAVLTMSFNASICIVYKYFTELKIYSGANYGFVMFMYVGAAFVSVFTLAYWKIKRGTNYGRTHWTKDPKDLENKPITDYKLIGKPNKHQVFATIFVALNMAIYDTLDVFCIANSPGPFYFPMVHGLTLLLSIIVGIIFYKEKHNKLQYVAILLVFSAIILLSIGQ